MSYDRMTSDDPTLRRDPVYRTQPDSGTRTVAYIVAALIVLGLVYLAATAFWGDTTTVPASTTTIEQTLPPATPPATMTPAPDIAPAPDAMAPAPDLSAPPAAPAPDATLAPEPAPVPPVTEPAQ